MTQADTPLTALVTGSSRGIGAAIARALRARGVQVIGHATRALDPSTIAADLTDPTAPSAIWDEALDRAGGRIDLLVNNAAIYHPFAFDEGSDAMIRQHLDINVLGVAWAIRAAIPHLRKTKGQIVSISSESVRMPFPMLALYAASKAAVETLSEGLREELRSDGIRVSVLRSGSVSGGSGGESWSDETKHRFYSKIVETGHAAMSGSPATPQSMASALLAMVSLPRDVSVDLIELRAAQAGLPEGAIAVSPR